MPNPGRETRQQKLERKYKLIGKDYTTPDLYAKVTGSQNMPKISAQRACCSASCC